ncbi:uncharacterized protein UHOD_11716 [Ustilago sp. UG-2017b]|nr:uncharacterized protein UHOD_11716 [Ustilago sp. UG-2017b]
MTTSTDDSLDISAQLFWQSTTPTSSATQTESMPALSQSGSTSAPDIHTSCPTRASRSATGKKNFTWSGADVLHLVTILYNSESYQRALCQGSRARGLGLVLGGVGMNVVMMTPRSGVSVDEVDGVGDKVGGVGGNSVASTRVSSVLTNA